MRARKEHSTGRPTTWLARALVLLVLVATGCAGGLFQSEPKPPPLAPGEARPAFWRVESDSGASLYLLGSIHFGPATGWVYPAPVLEAYDASSAVVVELDLEHLEPEAYRSLLMRYGLLPGPLSLETQLTPETLALLEAYLDHSNLPREAIMRMRPWMVSSMIVLEAAEKLGYTPAGGVDRAMVEQAGARSIIELESAEEQMSIMGGISPDLQEYFLLDALGHENDVSDHLSRMVMAWRRGDNTTLEKIVFQGLDEHPDAARFYAAIIFDRNRRMAREMIRLLEASGHRGESVFVVVGAAHLVGAGSIRDLLERSGYVVERIHHPPPLDQTEPGESIAVHP
jgi:uncharacterized protein YbaP (TraB family)